jgi:hypothetical protein
MQRPYQVVVEEDEVVGEEGSAMEEWTTMMSLENQRRLHVEIVAEGGVGEGVDLLGLEGVTVMMLTRWKKLVDMMMDIMHHLCKDMKVAGAGVGAAGVVVGAEGEAVDLLHKSRLAGASALQFHDLQLFIVRCNILSG